MHYKIGNYFINQHAILLVRIRYNIGVVTTMID